MAASVTAAKRLKAPMQPPCSSRMSTELHEPGWWEAVFHDTNTASGGHHNDTMPGYVHVSVTIEPIVQGWQLMYLAVMICEAACYINVQ